MAQELYPQYQVILVPGLHNSSADHWQSLWHASHPEFYRVEQDDWDDPDLPGWTARLDQVRALDPRPALFIAHSFGCLASVASIAANPADVAGALLAAPADPHKFGIDAALPHAALPAPSILISSRDDPWMAPAGAALWAHRWASELLDAGAIGHINAASGLGDWPFGRNALQSLVERASSNHAAAKPV